MCHHRFQCHRNDEACNCNFESSSVLLLMVLGEIQQLSSIRRESVSIWLFVELLLLQTFAMKAFAVADICYEGFAEGELTFLLALHWLPKYLRQAEMFKSFSTNVPDTLH